LRSVAIAGSTGSIGTQAVEVVRANRDDYEVVAIGAGRSVDLLVEQAAELHPKVVAIADEALAPQLKERVPAGTEVRAGVEALASIATEADVCLNAVVGFAGLPVTLAALTGGKRLALANKESLIAGGPLVQAAGGEIVPVDSEHSALHMCLRSGRREEVSTLTLTASGGPFRGRKADELASVTVDDALAHPTWNMGPKITVDSSTLMNKGLEVIEAHLLFGIPYDHIEVVVHPQSIVHSVVTFTDGASIAQLSEPDMRLPIGYALGWPNRLPTPFGGMDWTVARSLTFEPPDVATFRCLALAYEAGRTGGMAPAWLNAANEVAVAAFLTGRIAWSEIPAVIEDALTSYDGKDSATLDVVLDADRRARERARASVEERAA
jgi:1-deoxy-D-xylulose-5-phosphate reductoisomerase